MTPELQEKIDEVKRSGLKAGADVAADVLRRYRVKLLSELKGAVYKKIEEINPPGPDKMWKAAYDLMDNLVYDELVKKLDSLGEKDED